jgi:transcriptional regulator NrdR family protein
MLGMDCPSCRAPAPVLDSRPADDGAAVRRRRRCASCGERFTTLERVAPADKLEAAVIAYVRGLDATPEEAIAK